MRFLLFDRVLDVVPGKRIHGVKTVTLTEPYLDGHFPKAPLVPGPLLVEAMIQLLAWTAITKHDFKLSCVLSVLEDVEVPPQLRPGHRLDLHGQLMGTNKKGSVGRAWAEIEGEEVARVGRVIYGHVPHPDPDVLRERFRYYGGPA
ncbi:MAG: hypothetical protein QNJ98_02040 [Planctomycetota bacterium]|nr:hypothetical protein [Planctomycetota bacterium]